MMKKTWIALFLALTLLLSSCEGFGGIWPGGSAGDVTTDSLNGADTGASNIPSTDREHTDANDDGYCDDCSISVIACIDFYALNDLHGKFSDSDRQPGVDELTAYLKQAYRTDDHVILLSSGDMWQGSSESNFTKGMIITDWMNELDFVSMTLGNHEFDWGEAYIEANAEIAEFPFLAINLYDRDGAGDKLVPYCRPSVMVERGGATIGIIGAIGDCYSSISGEMSKGITIKTGSELTQLVKAESQRLRAAGADYIVYSIHDGFGSSQASGTISDAALSSYYAPVLSEGYVDLVFEGHSHQQYVLTDNDGVYHVQSGGDNRGLGHVEVEINFANGKSDVNTAEFVPTRNYENLEDDPIVEELLGKYEEQIAAGSRVLGLNDYQRSSEDLCNLVAELYLQVGEETWGEAYDIVLGGGFLSVRSPYNLAGGSVTYAQLQMLLPFDNTIVLCSIRGSDLLDRFIHTTNDRYFNYYGPYGLSVKDHIDPTATYYVVVDSYTSTYAPNRLTEVARYTEGVYARDLVADYIEAGGLTSTPVDETSLDEIHRIGQELPDNALSDLRYTVRGTVISVASTQYGNMTIQDEAGNTLFIYGVYDATGNVRYDALEEPPVVGDTVVLCGPIKKYVKDGGVTIELFDAHLLSVA